MGIVFEFLFEVLFEAADGVATGEIKAHKVLRRIAAAVIILLYTAAIGLMFFVSFAVMKENKLGGLVFLALTVFMLVMNVRKFITMLHRR